MSSGTIRTISALLEHLIDTAKLTGVPYSEAALRSALTTFEAGFLHGSVQFRTTSKPVERRDLCFRYLDLASGVHPLDVAERTGALDTGHPLFDWLHRLGERCPALGYGADFEARHGLVKIWHFSAGAYDPRALLELPEVPRALRPSLPLLRDLHLDAMTILGVDYAQRSINLYFRPSHPSHRGPELLARACERLGFPTPSAAALAHAARAGCIAVTYGWDAPEVERICFYVAGFRRDDVPDYHPHLREFARSVPALVDDPRFIVGWSHGRTGPYFKIEDDYTGDVSGIFQVAMNVPKIPLAPPVQRPAAELQFPAL